VDAYDRAAIDHPLSDVRLRGNRNHADQCLRTCLTGKDVVEVLQYEKLLELEAMWLRLGTKQPMGRRYTPSVMRKRMAGIANAARKLLKQLEGPDPAQRHNGPELAVLEVLASADDGDEDTIIRATMRIERLIEILEATEAARELERCAHKSAEDVTQMGKLIVPKGHRGEAAANDWIAAIMSLYKQITGKDPRTSVIAPGRLGEGKAAGPLIRFLKAAGKPLGMNYSADSWRGRVEDLRRSHRNRK
jgi:hypothetical protein